MHVSNVGRALIERNEGCVLHAYRDVVGVLTIGYGYTGRGIYEGQEITQAEADAMLSARLAEEFEPGVMSSVLPAPITQNQFDAMVSLAFNIGLGRAPTAALPGSGFRTSSVLRFHRAGNYVAAADAFLLWNKAGGRVLKALDRRRREERDLYLTGTVAPTTAPTVFATSGSAHARTLRLQHPYLLGADVQELQEALGMAQADGAFGPNTDAAVREYQSNHGLVVDGIVGPRTWTTLGVGV